MWSHGLWASMAAACIISLACGSNESESNEAQSSAPSQATTGAASSAADETAPASQELPLYGTYLRDVPALELEPPAARGVENTWALDFQDKEEWEGVLGLYYFGRKPGTQWGRAYTYSSDGETLRLGTVTPPKDVDVRPGGFDCRPDGSATYSWSRSEDNRELRLEAVTEPCGIRRAILEGDWVFFD